MGLAPRMDLKCHPPVSGLRAAARSSQPLCGKGAVRWNAEDGRRTGCVLCRIVTAFVARRSALERGDEGTGCLA